MSDEQDGQMQTTGKPNMAEQMQEWINDGAERDTIINAAAGVFGALVGAYGAAQFGPLGAALNPLAAIAARAHLERLFPTLEPARKNGAKLREELGDDAPGVPEVMSTYTIAEQVMRGATNKSKLKLIQSATSNAFDPELYKQGLSRHLFATLDRLEYPEIELLERIHEAQRPLDAGVPVVLTNATKKQNMNDLRSDVELWNYFVKKLSEENLIVPNGSYRFAITPYGHAFLEFVESPDSND